MGRFTKPWLVPPHRKVITIDLFQPVWEASNAKCYRPFPSSPGPLYQNEVKCSAFDMEIIFHCHASKTHFHKRGCALGLILKVRVFGTQKWPISFKYIPTMIAHYLLIKKLLVKNCRLKCSRQREQLKRMVINHLFTQTIRWIKLPSIHA